LIRLPTELNEIIKQGGTVVVPSRQRAHAARLALAAAHLSQGHRVWATPDILPVEGWLTREVERYAASAGADLPRLLSPAEDWFLWRQCATEATGELELVNRSALAEALRRASAIAADFGIDIRNVGQRGGNAPGSGPNAADSGANDVELALNVAESGLNEAESGLSTTGLGLQALEPGLSDTVLGPNAVGLGLSTTRSGLHALEPGLGDTELGPNAVGSGLNATESGFDTEGLPGTEAALLAEVQRAVDERCRLLGAATAAALVGRLPPAKGGSPVVCSGFVTIPPRLRPLVGPSQAVGSADAAVPKAIIAADELDELERIAHWCKTHVERDPGVRILIAMPGAPGTRERLATLIRQAIAPGEWFAGESAESLVVIEGGVPLARVPAVAHALATLSWLGGNTGDFEAVSEWLRAPYWQAPGAIARARLDLWLRERERMHFDLHELSAALGTVPSALTATAREISAQIAKAAITLGQGSASPRDWSERFRAALEVFDWPGERARSSGEQQTVVRFYELLDEFGQLASAARSISRANAIQWFTELAARTAYRPADDDGVVTISSVLAAPVVRYDAIWIAGLHAEAFPQPVQPDPFLPLAAQIAAGVPAASAAGRLAEARSLLSSWRACADELILSAPARSEDLELLPSPLLAEWLPPLGARSIAHGSSVASGQPVAHSSSAASEQPVAHSSSVASGQPVAHGSSAASGQPLAPDSLAAATSVWLPLRIHREGLLETLDDTVGPAWPIERPLPSGTRSLELQNQCPFRAYAELRLGSTPLDAPEPGIAADLRGQLLHAALQKLWSRLVDSHGLAALSDAALDAAILQSVEEAADETLRRLPSQMPRPPASSDAQGDLFADPQRSPALVRECRRATRLIRTLCAVERERAPFRVESTELDSTLRLMGAQLRIRIDRVDALESGGRVILDYKSGMRTTADWYGDRPSHPQLLAYLAALGQDVVAMATVNVTAREVRFDGIANSAELLPKVKGVEGPFGTDPSDAWPIRRREWLSRVEHLAAAFLAGQAAVDPKPGACDYCHVASICRISERVMSAGADAPAPGAADE
jgi:ATP-dependent helicase/nuclease subunit B